MSIEEQDIGIAGGLPGRGRRLGSAVTIRNSNGEVTVSVEIVSVINKNQVRCFERYKLGMPEGCGSKLIASPTARRPVHEVEGGGDSVVVIAVNPVGANAEMSWIGEVRRYHARGVVVVSVVSSRWGGEAVSSRFDFQTLKWRMTNGKQ